MTIGEFRTIGTGVLSTKKFVDVVIVLRDAVCAAPSWRNATVLINRRTGGAGREEVEDRVQVIVHALFAKEAIREFVADVQQRRVVRVCVGQHHADRVVKTVKFSSFLHVAPDARELVVLAKSALDRLDAVARVGVGLRRGRDQLDCHTLGEWRRSAGVNYRCLRSIRQRS